MVIDAVHITGADHGRAVLWLSVWKDELAKLRNDFEDACLLRLTKIIRLDAAPRGSISLRFPREMARLAGAEPAGACQFVR